jgi:RND family efflux transporter MFP subunit
VRRRRTRIGLALDTFRNMTMTLSSLLRRSLVFGSGVLLALPAVLLTAGCNNTPPPAKDKRVEVTVVSPITDDVIDYQDFTGRLDAYRTVDIKARVTGYLTRDVMFVEGQRVTKGQPLYLIDPRPYQALYDQAVTQINLYEATLKLAKATLLRDEAASGTGGAVSPQTLDQDRAAVSQAEAQVESAKAMAKNAKINLDYTLITAPFDGKISRRYVDPGNDITADNTLLTTIVTESPVYAYFDVDERTFLELQKMQSEWLAPLLRVKAGLSFSSANPLPLDSAIRVLAQGKVLMRLANEEHFTRLGTIDFVDNRVIATTGTIRMRGVFDNANGDLTSGLFARVRLPMSKPYEALLIPDEAILSDQGKKYVWVVNDKDQVEYRNVELGQAIDTLRVIKEGVKRDEHGVITEGLTKDDRIVVVGMQRVKAKQAVTVKVQDPPKKPESPMKLLMRKGE